MSMQDVSKGIYVISLWCSLETKPFQWMHLMNLVAFLCCLKHIRKSCV